MANEKKPIIDLPEITSIDVEDLLYVVRGLASGRDKKILAGNLLKEEAPGFNNMIIDGGLRSNQQSGTGRSTDGYIIDMHKQSSTVGTLTSVVSSDFVGIVSSGEANLNKNKIAYSLASSDMYHFQDLKDVSTNAGKTICMFANISSTSGISDIKARHGQIFGSGGSSTVITNGSTINIPISTSRTWFRLPDIAIPSISGKIIGANNYVSYQIATSTAQTKDITIHDWVVIEKPTNIPDNVIPEWIKQDEDATLNKDRVLPYLEKIAGGTVEYIGNATLNSSTLKCLTTLSYKRKVQTPTITFNYSNINQFTTIAENGSVYVGATDVGPLGTGRERSGYEITMASVTADSSAMVRLSSGDAYFLIDSRF